MPVKARAEARPLPRPVGRDTLGERSRERFAPFQVRVGDSQFLLGFIHAE